MLSIPKRKTKKPTVQTLTPPRSATTDPIHNLPVSGSRIPTSTRRASAPVYQAWRSTQEALAGMDHEERGGDRGGDRGDDDAVAGAEAKDCSEKSICAGAGGKGSVGSAGGAGSTGHVERANWSELLKGFWEMVVSYALIAGLLTMQGYGGVTVAESLVWVDALLLLLAVRTVTEVGAEGKLVASGGYDDPFDFEGK